MILYLYDLKTQAYTILLHRLTVNHHKKACLLINKHTYADATVNDYPYALAKKDGLFSRVYAGELYVGKIAPEDNPSTAVVNHFNKMFCDIGLNLDDFEEIYATNDNLAAETNLYLNLTKRDYFWIEPVQNCCSYTPYHLTNPSLVPLFNELRAMDAYAEFAHPIIRINSDKSQLALKKKKEFIIWNDSNTLESFQMTLLF